VYLSGSFHFTLRIPRTFEAQMNVVSNLMTSLNIFCLVWFINNISVTNLSTAEMSGEIKSKFIHGRVDAWDNPSAASIISVNVVNSSRTSVT